MQNKNQNNELIHDHSKLKKCVYYFIVLQILAISIIFFSIASSKAETIDNITKEVQTFDDWTVVCNKDMMMEEVRCKVAARFYNNTSSVFVQLENKIANQVVFIIPNALPESVVKIKVGKNEVIESSDVEADDFAVIPMRDSLKKKVLEEMKADNSYLYIRFYVRDSAEIDGRREITERVSLAKFKDVMDYYYSQVTKKNNSNSNQNKK